MGDYQTLIDSAEQRCLNLWRRGPIRTTWTALPPQVGDRAPDFRLTNQAGKAVQLSDYWKQNPALILFWRHFGCGCGMDRAKRLAEEYEEYLAEGTTVVMIGQGDPERAAAYGRKYELPPVDILVDPDETAYEGYGLLEAKPSQIVFDAPEAFQRRKYEAFAGLAKARREADRPLVDNPWLLPGEFVVDQAGLLRLTYRYNYCEDFPDKRVLIAAIREAHWGKS